MKKALITGAGQDSSYLAEHLLGLNYEVHIVARRASLGNNLENFKDIRTNIKLHQADITDAMSITRVIGSVNPDEVYNTAGQTHIGASWEMPLETAHVNAIGAFNVFEAVRLNCPEARIYQAGTAEMFAESKPPQHINTPFYPTSPYGCSKVFAHYQAINYRERYGMHISNAILFNHTSERRPISFVTRKITSGVASIYAGELEYLELGNIDVSMDIGYAPEFVKAFHLMLQKDKPDDYIIGTGESHTLKEFLDISFSVLGLNWEGCVRINPAFFRPLPTAVFRAYTRPTEKALGWKQSISYKDMVTKLVKHDLRLRGWNG